MSRKLLLCPFCGGEAAVHHFFKGRYVVCENCGAQTDLEISSIFFNARKKVIKDWNNRKCYRIEECDKCGSKEYQYPETYK